MGEEVDDQTRIIQEMTSDVDQQGRIIEVNVYRTRKVK